MKNSYKLFSVVLAALTLGAVACTEKNEPYQVPEAETGAQFYFATTTPTSYKITPTVESFQIPVYRAAKEVAANAKVTVTDTSKTVFAEGSKVFDLAFAAGQNSVDVTLPIVFKNFNYGDLFGLTLEIAEQTTVYAPSTLKIEISLPEPWKSLGKTGKFYDGFFMENPVSGIEIEQNELYPNQFRVIKPYAKAPNVSGLSKPGNATDFIYLTVMKPGDKDPVRDITITENDLVYFQTYYSGYFHDSYGDDIKIYWPGVFNSQSTEDKWLFNKVLSYQSDGPDALPAQIQLAPFYYMDSVGGWNYTQKDGMILITFPGAVIKDYSIAAEYEGILTNEEGDFALVDVTLGEDVELGYAAIVPGEDPQAALALILAGDESVIELEESGAVKFPLTEAAEAYSYVVVSFAADDFQELDYGTIAYKDYSIAVAAKDVEVSSDGVSGTVDATVTFGKDVEFAKVAVLDKAPADLTDSDLGVFLDDKAEGVYAVRYSGQEFTFDLPKAGVYSIVAVSFAEEKAWNVGVAKAELVTLTFVYNENFEDINNLSEWLAFDADGDGKHWGYSNTYAAHSGAGVIYSASYDNNSGALTPDNWIVSAPINFTEDNYLSFWVAAQDPAWNKEHYAVYFFAEAPKTVEDLVNGVKVHEATIPEGDAAQEETPDGDHLWQRFVIAIPADLAGKTGYVAFRHFESTDMYVMNIDDVAVTEGNPVAEAPAPKAKAHQLFYNADFTARKNKPVANPAQAVVVAKGKHIPAPFESIK